MPVRNAHFYGQNSGRAYPVDETATLVSDAGRRLPPDLIVDLALRWPLTLGRYAFVAAVASTESAVTVTVQAADAPDAASGFAPLAAITLPKQVTEGRVYALAPQAAGVSGWIVFGPGVTGKPYHGRFSTPAQARLAPRAARAYRPLPVTGLQVAGAAEWLTGVVTLRATPPLEVAKEERYVAGAYRDCVVVRLVDATGADGFPVPAATAAGTVTESVFAQFAGPCSGRPESNTCGCPQPIETVNSVPPDEYGVLTVEFRGCAQLARVADGGAAVACEFGLVDACLPPQIPSSEGLLPGEYLPLNPPVPPDVPPPVPPPGTSDSLSVGPELPVVACFLGSNPLTEESGEWDISSEASPTTPCVGPLPVYDSDSLSVSTAPYPDGSLVATSGAVRNVSVLDGDVSSVYRRAVTEVLLDDGGPGFQHNAHLVINYQPHPTATGQVVYFAAEVNYDTQQFRLLRFNGVTFQEVAPAAVVAPGIQLGKWYRVTATCLPGGSAGDVTVTIRLESVSDPGVLDVLLEATVSNYQPSVGKFGVGSNRARSLFDHLIVSEAP